MQYANKHIGAILMPLQIRFILCISVQKDIRRLYFETSLLSKIITWYVIDTF